MAGSFGNISSSEIKPIFTTEIVDRFDELMEIRTTGFLRSFFAPVISKVLYPAIEVRRGTEKVGVDITLGSQGTRTQITKATQKIYDPYYFFYFSDVSKLDCYYNTFGSGTFNFNSAVELADKVTVSNKSNMDLIDRAIELWCAEVMEFGTTTSLRDGTVIDFGRKAESIVDLGAGHYWNVSGVDPSVSFQAAGEFMRKEGKYAGTVFHAILGSEANLALQANDVILSRAKSIETLKLETIIAPTQLKADGQAYRGTYTAGSYTFHLWEYPQFYELADAYPETPTSTYTLTPYINPIKVFVLPAEGILPGDILYGACPQIGLDTASLEAGPFHMKERIDTWNVFHEFGVESRPMVVPKLIDRFYTMQVIPA